MDKKKVIVPIIAGALVLSAGGVFVAVAHADTGTTTYQATHQKPAAVGTVTAISGDSITLNDTQDSTTYTVDATNATIQKITPPSTSGSSSGSSSTSTTPPARPTPTTISVSDIAVGDTLSVQGTVSGDSISATSIMDGQFMGGRGGFGGGRGGPGGGGVMGTVTAVNGNSITVSGKNGTTYTVDGSSATVSKMETISVSDIAVGDTVGIQGIVSGDSVTAKNIMDGMPQGGPQWSGNASTNTSASTDTSSS